jgi:hypothetical protein
VIAIGSEVSWSTALAAEGWAPPHGVREVVGEFLAENVAMIDLARHLGFRLRHLPEDRQIIEARLSLAPPPPRSLANDPIVG